MKEPDPQIKSKGFDLQVAGIRESCKDDPQGMFESLIEEYKDEDYFSSDMDEQIDRLNAFAYIGTTTMKHMAMM